MTLPWRCLSALGGLLLAAPLLAALQLQDGMGRTVALEQPPERIVSLFSSNTELLAALGLAPRIVGIEDHTHYPPGIREGRQIVGGRLGFSPEAIARLQPDLVVITPARGAANSLTRPMELVGIPVLVLLHSDIEQIFSNLALLGQATGVSEQAEVRIADLRARLDQVQSRINGQAAPRVYLELGEQSRGAWQTVREGTYTADALRLAGADNVFAGLEGITQVSGEAVIRANPEVILLANQVDPTLVSERPGWQQIDAVRNGRIYPVERARLLIPGPRVIDGVEQIAHLLYPEQP